MDTATKYTTVCNLCGQKFEGSPLTRIVGGIDPRMMKMAQALLKHMQTGDQKHQQYAASAALVASFQIEDPVAVEFLSGMRYAIHYTTRRNYTPTEALQDKIASLGLAEEDAKKVLTFCIELRDFLTESGIHTPAVAQPNGNHRTTL